MYVLCALHPECSGNLHVHCIGGVMLQRSASVAYAPSMLCLAKC